MGVGVGLYASVKAGGVCVRKAGGRGGGEGGCLAKEGEVT